MPRPRWVLGFAKKFEDFWSGVGWYVSLVWWVNVGSADSATNLCYLYNVQCLILLENAFVSYRLSLYVWLGFCGFASRPPGICPYTSLCPWYLRTLAAPRICYDFRDNFFCHRDLVEPAPDLRVCRVCCRLIGAGTMGHRGHVPSHFYELLGTGGHREQKNIRSTAFGNFFQPHV